MSDGLMKRIEGKINATKKVQIVLASDSKILMPKSHASSTRLTMMKILRRKVPAE